MNNYKKECSQQNNIIRDFKMAVMATEGMMIDITENDDKTWFKIGYSIANTFGADGRNEFHAISKSCTHYSEASTNRKYDKCLDSLGKYNIDIGFFFFKVNQAFYKETGMSLRGFLYFVHSNK